MKFLFCFLLLLVSHGLAGEKGSLLPEVKSSPRDIALREVTTASATLVQLFKFGALKQNRYKVDLTFTLGSDVQDLASRALLTIENSRAAKLSGEPVVFRELNASYLSPRVYEFLPAKQFISSEAGKEQKLILPLQMVCRVSEPVCVEYVTWESYTSEQDPSALVKRVFYRVVLDQQSTLPADKRVTLEKLDPTQVEFNTEKPVGI